MLKLKLPSKSKKFTKSGKRSSPTAASSNNSSSDDDNCIDDSSHSVESELLKLYDSCQSLPAERRESSFAKKKDATTATVNDSYSCCSDSIPAIPPSPPSKWPQRPIHLRPSPDSGMKILGVRKSSSNEYLTLHESGYCQGCTLPINNGYEKSGECLVIDFETDLFVGSLLLRVKNISFSSQFCSDAPSEEASTYDTATDNYYFYKKKRTFQATVKGRFKQFGIPMSECITGQMFNRPAGYLPPRVIVKGAVSIISRLAPQLQARLEGDCPRFLSPLVSTAQTVLVQPIKDVTSNQMTDEIIEDNICEPQASDESSIIQSIIASGAGDQIGMSTPPSESNYVSSRIKARKRASDKIFAAKIKTPTFDTNKEYTFEFFQHLITFDDFCLDFVKPIGKHSLHGMLNGQPLKFMAAQQTFDQDGEEALKWLWCFDIWHENLYQDALAANDDRNES
jgi:hypothetical protein